MHLFLSLSLSVGVCVYIYIYIYMYTSASFRISRTPASRHRKIRTYGVSIKVSCGDEQSTLNEADQPDWQHHLCVLNESPHHVSNISEAT